MKKMPNIILIMTDEQRADFSKQAGFPLDVMPFLDSWAAGGTRFARAYTSAPTCVPARCSLFTGRFAKAHMVRDNFSTKTIFFGKDLLDVLKEKGYLTALVGKNHSYLKEKWDQAKGYGHWGESENSNAVFKDFLVNLPDSMSCEATPFPLEEQAAYKMVDDARQFVETAGTRPFFLWLSFPEPHYPYQVPEPYFSMFPAASVPERCAGSEVLKNKNYHWRYQRELIERYAPDTDKHWRRYRANYCGQIRMVDDQIRRFLEYLEKRGGLDETLVVFLSDHGDFAGDYGLERKGVGLPECLMRIPMIWRGPGIRRGILEKDAFVSIVDVFPTLCEYVGAAIPAGVQGRSILPILAGEDYPRTEFGSIFAEAGFNNPAIMEQDNFGCESFMCFYPPPFPPIFNELNDVTQSGNRKMIRKDKWKLIVDETFGAELYDLEQDPAELDNLYDRPDLHKVKDELLAELVAWMMRTDNSYPVSERYKTKQNPHNWRRGTVCKAK